MSAFDRHATSHRGFAIRRPRARLVGVAAALSVIAVAAPASTAVADPFVYPLGVPAATVVGPTIITTAPSSFINTNNQVSAGGNASGQQIAAP